jgi:hypothetical protein
VDEALIGVVSGRVDAGPAEMALLDLAQSGERGGTGLESRVSCFGGQRAGQVDGQGVGLPQSRSGAGEIAVVGSDDAGVGVAGEVGLNAVVAGWEVAGEREQGAVPGPVLDGVGDVLDERGQVLGGCGDKGALGWPQSGG